MYRAAAHESQVQVLGARCHATMASTLAMTSRTLMSSSRTFRIMRFEAGYGSKNQTVPAAAAGLPTSRNRIASAINGTVADAASSASIG
jgi:hypothetical protein